MTEQNSDPKNTSVSYLSYVRAVHNELVSRTRVEAYHKSCAAALDGAVADEATKQNPLKVSGRGIRSAFATLCFKQGTPAADVLKIPTVASSEFPSPSAVCSALLRFAERHLAPDIKLTDAQWGEHETLNHLLFEELHLFMSILMGTALTEELNADAGTIDGETGLPTPHVYVQTDTEVVMGDDPFDLSIDPFDDGASVAGVLLSLPQNLVTLAEGLVKIPAERRGAAAAEIIRYANSAPAFEQNNQFPGMVATAVVIYG